MDNLHILGENTTIPADNMTIENVIDNLSENATELLCFIAEELFEENEVNERGIAISHDSFHCKPWNTIDVEDLMSIGVITVHHSSGDGTHFIHCNQDVYDVLAEFGEILT